MCLDLEGSITHEVLISVGNIRESEHSPYEWKNANFIAYDGHDLNIFGNHYYFINSHLMVRQTWQ